MSSYQKHDVYFFLGTTLQYHARRAPNPFIIVRVFYPLKQKKLLRLINLGYLKFDY